jgi:hypothetical protein
LAIRPLESRDRKLHEIVRSNDPEDYPYEKRKFSPRGVMHDGWCGKLIPNTASLKLASASRQHILDPLAFPSVGECDQESIRLSKNINGRLVEPA